MDSLTFKLEDFEGPLDLLLYLVSKNKMNIYDVNIVALIDQYLIVIRSVDDRLDAGSEFIEMAARLVQMKSFFLLPKSEEAERIKAELTGMLVEYSLCKQVAAQLRTMADGVYTAVREPADVDLDPAYRLHHDVYVLEEAYNSLQGRGLRRRAPDPERFEPIVQAPFVSVNARILYVLRSLKTGRRERLSELFDKNAGRSQTVATFLAVLELMRGGRVTIRPDGVLQLHKTTRRSARPDEQERSEWN